MKNIDVCILVGGFGTRLKPILKNQPKVLSKFLGNPILSYILDQLIEDGFRKVCLLTGYKSDEIKEFYGNRYKNLEIFYSEEEIPLGTGGAVKFFSKDRMLLKFWFLMETRLLTCQDQILSSKYLKISMRYLV